MTTAALIRPIVDRVRAVIVIVGPPVRHSDTAGVGVIVVVAAVEAVVPWCWRSGEMGNRRRIRLRR